MSDSRTFYASGGGELVSLLSGAGAPPSGSGLEPLDGINDPWRWAPYPPVGGWVGPAYSITVADGATLPAMPTSIPAGCASVELHIARDTDTVVGSNDPANAIFRADGNDAPVVAMPYAPAAETFHVAPDEGSVGIAFMLVYETDYAGPTVIPPAVADLDVLDFLAAGTGITVGDPYEFPDVALGVDGQFYIDTATRNLYGPRTAGTWAILSTLPAPE